MATVELAGDTFEAGASILHPKNLHAVHFVELLGLKRKSSPDSDSFGIWDGQQFLLKTLQAGDSLISRKVTEMINTLALLWRYGTSLLKMQNHVTDLLEKWMHFYDEDRLVYDSVEELLKSVNLYDTTQNALVDELLARGLSTRLIDELVTMITRINYGQNVSISGLAGAVSLCGSGKDLWAVEGGNWQMAAGIIRFANASLHLHEEVVSVSSTTNSRLYMLTTASGQSRECDVVVIATPLDEVKIAFSPSIELPFRQMQHTFATFVRGIINPGYFGMDSVASMPILVGTTEDPALPFSSISVLREYSESDKAYKVFSRSELTDEILDQLFRTRSSTITLDWAAYPHYHAPEKFAPFLLDQGHLYYVNAFENAASTMETTAVAAENVVRLVLSRLHGHAILKQIQSPPVSAAENYAYRDL
eukprot:TRINITY_DN13116_c0_g1_i1.p1 TRINITY_DN13116_c0_g1~~TRINITY_DN13116_c0_g1_i1.p1  ORF type:complete len:436 (+),score=83.11 TRINITY_DN13116_c0_g1_i1:51-1310(+)